MLLEVAHGLLVPFLRDLILLAAAGGRSVNFGRLGRGLDAEMLNLLQAYSEGVNDYLTDNRDNLHDLFDKTGLEPNTWTSADSIASWWHLAKWFAKDGLRDKIVADFKRPSQVRGTPVIDDDAAVVKREDVTDEWIAQVNAFMEKHGLSPQSGNSDDPPKFSHAWVIGGRKTTTGSAVLVSDPQTPVWTPSLLYEYHISGRTFNVRGVGVAGSPIILIGFNEYVA